MKTKSKDVSEKADVSEVKSREREGLQNQKFWESKVILKDGRRGTGISTANKSAADTEAYKDAKGKNEPVSKK